MKSLLVANSLPDIVYFWADEKFTEHLNGVFLKEAVINEDDDMRSVDLNMVLQYFSPLLVSQSSMQRLGCAYKSITLGNGMVIVLDQKDDHVYLAMNGDGQESEDFLRKKLRTFQCIVRFHFGLSLDLLKPNNRQSRKNLWESLSNILTAYCYLSSQQQAFLVGALEMIDINDVLNEMCLHILEAVVTKANREGDPLARHAAILVNSKVLALYTQNNARKLVTHDVMLLMALLNTKFPPPLQSIPLSVNRTPPPLAHDVIRFNDVHIKPKDCPSQGIDEDSASSSQFGEAKSANVDIKSGLNTCHSLSEDVFYREFSEERVSTGGEKTGESEEFNKESSDSVASDKYFTPPEEGIPESYTSAFSQHKSRLLYEASNSSNSYSDPDNELFRRRIFLTSIQGFYLPHTVHSMQIFPGAILLIISEVKRSDIAKDLCTLISIMADLIEDSVKVKETYFNIMEKVELHLGRIVEALIGKTSKKEKNVEMLVNAVRQKWENVKLNDLADHVQKKEKLKPGALESSLTNLLRGLQTLFGTIYCSGDTVKGPSISIHHAKALYRIQEMVQKDLKDYKGFLAVKSERNITLTPYLDEFPGMVHFLYVDRTTHRVVGPSINAEMSEIFNPRDPSHYIKQIIWDGWNYIQSFLVQGHTSVAVRYGDFLLSYVLWFEDRSGNQRPVKDTNAFATPFPTAPGIFGLSFYSELKRRCFPSMAQEKIHCRELFCMHLGALPASQAADHASRLAAKLGGTMMIPLLL